VVQVVKSQRFFLGFMYSIGIVSMLLGVCIKTVRRWDASKKIYCIRTPGGHRRFPIQEIRRLLSRREGGSKRVRGSAGSPLKCALYGRVSSYKQYKRGDLKRQVEVLKAYARAHHFEVYNAYKDVGSGLNTARKGLWRLLRDAKKDKFSLVLLTYKDRLTRFGYKYLKQYLSEFGVKVKYLNELDEKSPESEMVEDMIAIVHSFSGKLYGLRSGKNKKTAPPSLVTSE
jgi:putative resolvase